MDAEEILAFAQAVQPKKISVYAEDAKEGAVRRIE
jgi:hypothetical protein